MSKPLSKTLEEMVEKAHEENTISKGDWAWAWKEWTRLKKIEETNSKNCRNTG